MEPCVNGLNKNQRWDAAGEQRGIYSIPDDDPDYEEIIHKAKKDWK